MESLLIVGAGSGLSAALARVFARDGFRVILAARNTAKLEALLLETGAAAYTCDAEERDEIEAMLDEVVDSAGVPDLVVFNIGYRVHGTLVEIDPFEVERSLHANALAAFLVGQAAVRRMLPRGSGAIFFTGASASVKGYARSAPFAMGKFALHGLAQSMARELAPQGIHVAHFIIDGVIRHGSEDPRLAERADAGLLPDDIARSYLWVYRQPRSAWSLEVELRPWTENFR